MRAGVAALTAAVFAVHAVPTAPDAVVGSAPLLTAAGPAPAHRVVFRLPDGWRPAAALPGSWELTTGDALRRCRTEAQVGALAGDRGVREADGVLAFRVGAERRELRVARSRRGRERSWWREDLDPGGLFGRPVQLVVRFPTPPAAGLGPAAPSTTVRVAVLSHADVAPQARVTDALLDRCRRQTLRVAPPALDAVAATATVTSAPRGTP